MRFYKTMENGCITAIGTGGGGAEITEEEYNWILYAILSKPPRTETSDFQLKEDLTWEEYERGPEPAAEEDEISAEEALAILMGGEEHDET